MPFWQEGNLGNRATVIALRAGTCQEGPRGTVGILLLFPSNLVGAQKQTPWIKTLLSFKQVLKQVLKFYQVVISPRDWGI